MDTKTEQQDKHYKSSQIPLQDLRNLHFKVGFNIIPLRRGSAIPNVHSTNEICNNPEYWIEEKLESCQHLFYGVATLLGKSHIKDTDGSDLFLSALDIDSEEALTKLIEYFPADKKVNLFDELLQTTYVTKTKKGCGYHIYWYDRKQNKPVRTTDCKVGKEFEIKTDGGGHLTLPPSRHRDDPNFHYKNIGQNKIAIRDDLYDLLVNILTDCLEPKPGNYESRSRPFANESYDRMGSTDYSDIASVIAIAYRNGTRDAIVFDLSGFLYHQNINQENVENIVRDLCKLTDDEEVSSRLRVVQNTYEKPKNGEMVTGKNALFKTLERIVGIDTADQIIKDLMNILNKNRDPTLSQLNQHTRQELAGNIFEITCYNPLTLVVAHSIKKQILTLKTPRYSCRDDCQNNNKKLQVLKYGEVIINATPVKIIQYENPLNNQIKYKMDFDSSIGRPFSVPPSTVEDITKDLIMRGVVYKQRNAEELLNAILNGAQRQNKVSVVRQIDTPGFYFVDGKLVASEIGEYTKILSRDDIIKCAEFLNELVTRSKHPEMLVTLLKWGILSPFSHVFKQLSQDSGERYMPWPYLDGHTQTSKTTDAKIALAIHRKHKSKIGLSSADNVRRLADAISHSTFPILIDEVKLNPKIQAELIEAIKHSTQGETARTRLSLSSKPIKIPALSPCIMTSNHPLPADPALRRRFLNFHYPKEDKPTMAEIKKFESFLKPGLNLLGTLGDFTTNYLLRHQEIIVDDNNDWRSIAKIMLVEFHKSVDLNLPGWIEMISDGNPFEDAEVEEEELIRGYFKRKINDTFSKNYRALVPWQEQQVDCATNKYKLMEMRLNFCLDNQLISYLRRKNSNPSEILITKDILKELRDADISSIQHFADLARLLRADYKPAKLDHKPVRAIIIQIADLMDFIEKDPLE
jgi:hypothetical protein